MDLNKVDDHFFEACFALLIVLIYSIKNALIILDLTHLPQRTPPYGLVTCLSFLANLL